MLELKDRQIAAIKRQFKNSLPAIKKIESLQKKINELTEERDREVAYLNGGEAGIKALTGGYASYELIKCEYVPQFNEDGTPKMDKEGKYQVKKQVLTFVPPTETPMPEAGNDYDADVCQCGEPVSIDEQWRRDMEEVAQLEVERDYQNEIAFEKESLNSGVGVESANDYTSTEANESL